MRTIELLKYIEVRRVWRRKELNERCLNSATDMYQIQHRTQEAPSLMPRDDDSRDLRARLLAGDTTASNDVVTAYLDDLADWLEKHYDKEQPNYCLTAAEDAILAFIKNPMSYDPDKKSL